jgi:hypothetical protein
MSARSFLFAALLLLLAAALAVLVWVAREFGVGTPSLADSTPNTAVPRIVHLMYFPWDRGTQRLMLDQSAFDRTYLHALRVRVRQREPGWRVEMWTWPKMRRWCEKRHPGLWERAVAAAARPTQLVDLFRWLVVHDLGGVYLQYDSDLRCPRLDALLPSAGRGLRLYTENVWFTPWHRWRPALNPCRRGRPEEKVRVMNQVFSAVPGHPLVRALCRAILWRMCALPTPQSDYEILYLGANAFVSEMYERRGKHDPDVELANYAQTRGLVRVSSWGSWRTDHARRVHREAHPPRG